MEENLNESVEAASVRNGYATSCGSAFPLLWWRMPRKTSVIYYAINIWSVDKINNNYNNSNNEG